MAERSTISQTIQIGVETTPGTPVAANKQLQMIGIDPSPQANVDQFRPIGTKFRTIAALSKEWMEASVSGRLNYTEIVYVLASVLTGANMGPTTVGTTGKSWVFAPQSTNDDVPKTFTIEHGSSVRADSFSYALFNEFNYSINRDTCEVSGSILGRRISDGITLTASPASIAQEVTLATQVSVYTAATIAFTGLTLLTRVLSCSFHMGNRYGPVWTVNAAAGEWVAHVELEPDYTFSLMMEADTAGMGMLTTMRASGTKYVRVEGVGAAIAGGTAINTFTCDMALKVANLGGFSDADGVYAVGWDFVGIHDGTWTDANHANGKAINIAVINTLTAL